MAKVFDLVHKVSDESPDDNRIPFNDEPGSDNSDNKEPTKKKRPKVEVIFFYLLLFAVFFIMGAVFLAPNILTQSLGNKPTITESASPKNEGPEGGFSIDQEGQSTQDAAADLELTPSPVSSPIATANPVAPIAETETGRAAKIQIQNGTNITGAAAKLRDRLAQKGITVENIGNFSRRNVKRTTVYFEPNYKQAASQVLAVSGGIMVEANSIDGGYDILVIIGATN